MEALSARLAPSGLLRPVRNDAAQSNPNIREWEINFALLYSAYQRTDHEPTKRTIRFLMTNYLQKAAYLNAECKFPIEDAEAFENILQIGQMTLGGQYHRGAFNHQSMIFLLHQQKNIGDSEKNQHLIALDTTQIQELCPLSFITTPSILKRNEIVSILVEQFKKNLAEFPKENFPCPVLIDITDIMGESILTNEDPVRIKRYNEKKEAVRAALNDVFKKAANSLKMQYPDRKDIQEYVHDYLKMNTAVVCRAKISEEIGILLINSLFKPEDFDHQTWNGNLDTLCARENFICEYIQEWVEHTGLSIGAISFRKAAAELLPDLNLLVGLGRGQMVDYVPPGKTDVTLFETPEKILNSSVFNLLMEMSDGTLGNVGPAQQLLSSATEKMMVTLLRKIPVNVWAEKQEDPMIREITQNAMVRLLHHLATATHHRENFRKFAQAIDRAHAEMAAILTLYMPFEPTSFEYHYRKFLEPLFPKSIEPTTVGLAKTAMTLFAGVNTAVMLNNPSAVRICGERCYYEVLEVLGKTKNLEESLKDPSIEKIDLYVQEFHHNIDIDPKYTHYKKGTIAEDIKAIFINKPETDALTVVIDATIDFTRSEDLRELFAEFKDEIRQGRLNFVVFRSGQKFDMLGLDNYYGAPFYIVNNGDKKWANFDRIKTEKVYQTDELSEQFFCWMGETGFEWIEEYKKLLFENQRKIMELVPEGLKPKAGRAICISSFEQGVLAPFFEIAIDSTDKLQEGHRLKLHEFIVRLFMEEDKLIFERGSFGFHHPNLVWIDPKFRINPGLDPSEIPLYKELFDILEKAVLKYESNKNN